MKYDACGSSVTGAGAEETNSAVCTCFIDLTKAYDFVVRTLLWTVLARFGVPQCLSIPRWHASIRAARRQGMLGVVRCGTNSSSRVSARVPSVQHLLRGGYKRGLRVFQGGQRHHGRFGTPEEEKGAEGRGEATVEELVLATPLWGMLYADDAGVVSQSPQQLRKMMGVIVVVCAAFCLTVLEGKTEIMDLRAKRMLESTTIFSVEPAGQVYNQTNEVVYLGGDVNHNADLSIEVDRRIRNAWCSFRKYALELYDRPSASFELKIRMLRAEVPTRDNAVRLRHVEPARVPLRPVARSPPQVLDSLHRLAKA